jgi:hypothetical protein
MAATVRSTDTGWGARLAGLQAAAREAARWEVVVGVLADEKGSALEEGGDIVVLDLATIHEFGSTDGRVPQRSFLRAYVDEHGAQILNWQRALALQVGAGQLDVRQALELLGLKVAGAIQAYIAAGIAPPNAQATIDRKGSSTPLIDSGQLRSAITHQLRPKGGAAS